MEGAEPKIGGSRFVRSAPLDECRAFRRGPPHRLASLATSHTRGGEPRLSKATLHRCHAHFRVWLLSPSRFASLTPQDEGERRSGSGAHGRASLVFIRGAASAPRRRLASPRGRHFRRHSLGRGPGLWAHHPAALPQCDRPGAAACTRYPVRTGFPAQAMEGRIREVQGAGIRLRENNPLSGDF